MHTPVLLHEVLEALDPRPGEFFIDGTIDGGGHAREILSRIGEKGKLLGVDWDEGMIRARREEWKGKKNVALTCGNYAEIPKIMKAAFAKRSGVPKADGLLLDLGFSSEQIASSGRGFSFMRNEPLLMTYSDSRVPVRELIAGMRADELERVIREFGGERMAGRIARAVKERGRKKRILTTGELAEAVRNAVPKGYERGRIDPATRTFQALRIYANGELENLETLLGAIPEIMNQGGRVAIITFHSLEDRIVKTHFKKLAQEGTVELITKKPIVPAREEILQNPRSRTAKLRTARMTNF
ncbi:MAG: 16S rRNA (cytosine(1402)-N(4))-methyltransferase [Candidatus Liptonbacteria bacterium RIFCSPLOWO2_01_FULL_53_13]|uniref:Ribosomal RNA small subunit methyltransferase H n=1 Tax=Candidatus Liptonbacteria bacterium RIFCSPLOWO2_01_FULL_53_13 TaxID=1798651 RepID=A0A1G2CGH3_9BACT|nr:MAG: 16S rRNA (cytosine(1402)-N(4))-methyltransferase [Candidatus Liptonbacteria bacterium RIFCSPLOWO2_01_FULL_53_13]